MKLEYKIVPTCSSCVYQNRYIIDVFSICNRFGIPVRNDGVCIYYAKFKHQGLNCITDWFKYSIKRIIFPRWEKDEVRE